MIVAAVREVEPACRLTTFCARFDDDTLDELKYAVSLRMQPARITEKFKSRNRS